MPLSRWNQRKFLTLGVLAAGAILLASCAGPLEKNRNLGIKLYHENQFDQSLATLNTALSYDQFDAQSNTYAGLIEYRTGNYEQAAYYFKVALQSDPSSDKAKDGLTETLIKMGKPDLALDALERPASLAEKVNDPRENRTNVKRHYNGQVDENLFADKINDRIRIARAYQKLGDYDNAVLFYKKAIDLRPSGTAAWVDLGNLYAQIGNKEQARTCFVKAYNIDPAAPGLTAALTRNGIAISDLYGTPPAPPDYPPPSAPAPPVEAPMTPQTTATLSHQFIADLEVRRDPLYSAATQLALASPGAPGPSAKAESLLHAAVREAFTALEKNPALNPSAGLQTALAGFPTAPEIAAAPMPADVWARLVAAVQVEAARSAHSSAINPDSVLLSPDPLLAPKKLAAPDDGEGFNLSPSSRFLLAAAVAVLIGIALTIFLLTRFTPATSAGPAHHSASSPTTMAH